MPKRELSLNDKIERVELHLDTLGRLNGIVISLLRMEQSTFLTSDEAMVLRHARQTVIKVRDSLIRKAIGE